MGKIPCFTIQQAEQITGGLSKPSKMPGLSFNLPATECKTGAKLRQLDGSVCSTCYALKGRYRFGNVQTALYRRLTALSNPLWEDAMVFLIQAQSKVPYFRWHDSGDLQSMEHLHTIVRIAERLPHIRFWLPTKERALVKQWYREGGVCPENLAIRVSAAMIDGARPKGVGLVSSVTRDKAKVTCPAYTQGNVCGDCRMCWDQSVRVVVYPLH